jgi:predicted AAA+ superfamily ATPase
MKMFPAVLVSGPRQSGKTTLYLKEIVKKSEYVTFDDPLERAYATSDPNGFLDRFNAEHIILDEIQYVPEILPYIKIRIDRDRKTNGRWLLTGSQQFHLMKNISESLAGRIALLELLPFSFSEIPDSKKKTLQNTIWNGGYPEVVLNPGKLDLWLSSYIQTYIERDVRHLINVKELRSFELFIKMAASLHGQILNQTSISRDVGISIPTVKSWTAVLETSYIIYLLQPYYNNFGKRLIKSPKLYFLDSALVHALTCQPDSQSALAGAMGGALFEGWIITETVKAFTNKGKKPDIYFWRSHDGLEVDLIIQTGAKLIPVEIKLTSTPTLKHLEPLNKFKTLAGNMSAKTGILVCRTDKIASLPHDNLAIPWNKYSAWLADTIK